MIKIPKPNEKLPWNIEPDGQCYAILEDKSRCPNKTTKNKVTKKYNQWCEQHQPCLKKRKQMKESCEGSNLRCSDFKSSSAIDAQRGKIKNCLKNRIDMWETCYHPSVHDERHYRYIQNLDSRLDECNSIIEDLEPILSKSQGESISAKQSELLQTTKSIHEEEKSKETKTTTQKMSPPKTTTQKMSPPKTTTASKKKKSKKKKKSSSLPHELTKEQKEAESLVMQKYIEMAEKEASNVLETKPTVETTPIKEGKQTIEEKVINKPKIKEAKELKLRLQEISYDLRQIKNYGLETSKPGKQAIKLGESLLVKIKTLMKYFDAKVYQNLVNIKDPTYLTYANYITEIKNFAEKNKQLILSKINGLSQLDLYVNIINYIMKELETRPELIVNDEDISNLIEMKRDFKTLKTEASKLNVFQKSNEMNAIEKIAERIVNIRLLNQLDKIIRYQNTSENMAIMESIVTKSHEYANKYNAKIKKEFSSDVGIWLKYLSETEI